MIPAEVHDDECRTWSRFDATEWFQQASDAEIIALAQVKWTGDAIADQVAEFFEGRGVGTPETIDDVFRACNVLDCGFEVTLEADKALKWLQDNRPAVMAVLEKKDD